LLVVLILISPFVYANIQAYWAMLLVPTIKLFSIEGHIQKIAIMILMNFIATLFVSILLALPLGYVTKKHSIMFSVFLGLGLSFWLAWIYFTKDATEPSFMLVLRISEYVAIFLTFIIMARFGAYLSNKRAGEK